MAHAARGLGHVVGTGMSMYGRIYIYVCNHAYVCYMYHACLLYHEFLCHVPGYYDCRARPLYYCLVLFCQHQSKYYDYYCYYGALRSLVIAGDMWTDIANIYVYI